MFCCFKRKFSLLSYYYHYLSKKEVKIRLTIKDEFHIIDEKLEIQLFYPLCFCIISVSLLRLLTSGQYVIYGDIKEGLSVWFFLSFFFYFSN